MMILLHVYNETSRNLTLRGESRIPLSKSFIDAVVIDVAQGGMTSVAAALDSDFHLRLNRSSGVKGDKQMLRFIDGKPRLVPGAAHLRQEAVMVNKTQNLSWELMVTVEESRRRLEEQDDVEEDRDDQYDLDDEDDRDGSRLLSPRESLLALVQMILDTTTTVKSTFKKEQTLLLTIEKLLLPNLSSSSSNSNSTSSCSRSTIAEVVELPKTFTFFVPDEDFLRTFLEGEEGEEGGKTTPPWPLSFMTEEPIFIDEESFGPKTNIVLGTLTMLDPVSSKVKLERIVEMDSSFLRLTYLREKNVEKVEESFLVDMQPYRLEHRYRLVYA